jgi:hypothetical protein
MKKVKHLIVKSGDGTMLAMTLCPAIVEAFKCFKEGGGSAGFDISVPAETIPDVKACVAEMVAELQGDTRLTIELTEATAGTSPSSSLSDITTKLSVRFRQQTDSDITAVAAITATT